MLNLFQSRCLNTRLIQRALGTKPDHFKSEIEAPSIWGAMAALLEKIEGTTGGSPEQTQQESLASNADILKKMTIVETYLLATASTLSRVIQSQGHRLDSIKVHNLSVPTPTSAFASASSEPLKEELKEIRMEVRKMNANAKPHVVKFGGLILDSLSQATAWISTNVASKDIGLVVNPHTVFEHINANLSMEAVSSQALRGFTSWRSRPWLKATQCPVLSNPSQRYCQERAHSSSRTTLPTSARS
jgi:hypothetical protein